ncbi:PH domain-containing protein [Microbacterium oleivorans]|uniref:PH domain-containing protein n=1 Tax=Microbacterium oleivorans TaxID=273677 RepID=A0A7D5EVA7_9MICO|nr:PH domain-containing protein [Microbacterium oleivorans]QLD10586.1 PH domain-containing protein [Microbacterium oleivorans]
MRKTYRPASAVVAVAGFGILGVFLLVDVFVRGGALQGFLIAPWVLLALWVMYALLYAPFVSIDDRAIVIANPFRVTRVPWSAVSDVRLRWQVTVDTTEGRSFSAFGGPSPGRPARVPRGARTIEAHDAPRGPAAVREVDEIRERWRENADRPGESRVTTIWNRAVLIPLAVIAVYAVVAVVVGG